MVLIWVQTVLPCKHKWISDQSLEFWLFFQLFFFCPNISYRSHVHVKSYKCTSTSSWVCTGLMYIVNTRSKYTWALVTVSPFILSAWNIPGWFLSGPHPQINIYKIRIVISSDALYTYSYSGIGSISIGDCFTFQTLQHVIYTTSVLYCILILE